jgi:hypothetical protein
MWLEEEREEGKKEKVQEIGKERNPDQILSKLSRLSLHIIIMTMQGCLPFPALFPLTLTQLLPHLLSLCVSFLLFY